MTPLLSNRSASITPIQVVHRHDIDVFRPHVVMYVGSARLEVMPR